MAKLVHGNDAYTALEIAQRAGAGADPTYTAEYLRVPFAGESMAVARDQTPEVSEITRAGSVKTLSYGSGHWRGTFTTLLYYNAPWFHALLNQLMGGCEWLAVDRLPNDTACPGGVNAKGNTHSYLPQSFRCVTAKSIGAITHGIAMRMTKMGPDNNPGTSGIEKILGAYVTEAVFTHQLGSWPTATWTVEGPEPTIIDGSGVTPIAAPATHYFVKSGDLSMDAAHVILPSMFKGWGTSVDSYIDQYSLRIVNNLRFPARSLNALDTEHNIGHVGPYEVTMDVRVKARQEDWDAVNGSPYAFFQVVGSYDPAMPFSLRYISAPEGATHNPPQTPMVDEAEDVPYALEFTLPRPLLVAASAPVESGGALQITYSMRGRNDLWGLDAAPNSNKRAPVAVQVLVANTDEPAADTKFSVNYGGNDPDATLNT